MTVNAVQYIEYTSRFVSCVSIDNSFVFSTDDVGLSIVDVHPDLFRPSGDFKVLRTTLAYSKEKPFEDKNFKQIRHQGRVVCQEHNLTVHPNTANWCLIYMGSYSNIIFLEKNNNKWIEKRSDLPHKWFLIVSKKQCLSEDKNNLDILDTENKTLFCCRQKEHYLRIKNFVFTHALKHENKTEVYGTICCHVNNVLTFWSTVGDKSSFLAEYEFHNTTVNYLKWFQILNNLSWLIVFLSNGQIYVHEICDYPNVQHTFKLWSSEDFACVKNVWVEVISENQCLIFLTKMSFVLVILYSLTKKQILSLKKEMIPRTALITGLTFVQEKKMLIVVTDVGKFICMHLFITESDVAYTLKAINNSFNENFQNFTCTLAVFSKNNCFCCLTFECNMAKYSKNDGHPKNKMLFCTIPENLVELEQKILSVNNCNYDTVIDCIETLRISRINDNPSELYQLNRKSLDKCSIEYLKLTYWKIAFKGKKIEHEENILQELQILLHMRHLTDRLSNNLREIDKAEQYYGRIMLSYYSNKVSVEYEQMKLDAARLINLLTDVKHSYFCNTCERILTSFTDFKMFTCELEHIELRCPVTLGPLGMPCLICSMCFTMANEKAKNQNCVWCFGKYIPNELLF